MFLLQTLTAGQTELRPGLLASEKPQWPIQEGPFPGDNSKAAEVLRANAPSMVVHRKCRCGAALQTPRLHCCSYAPSAGGSVKNMSHNQLCGLLLLKFVVLQLLPRKDKRYHKSLSSEAKQNNENYWLKPYLMLFNKALRFLMFLKDHMQVHLHNSFGKVPTILLLLAKEHQCSTMT